MSKVIHFHFEIKNNIGDAAVVHTIRDYLDKELNVSNYTSMPINYISEVDYYNEIISKYSKWRLKKLSKILSLHYLVLLRIMLLNIKRRILGISESQLISLINKHDLMIVGGGGVYSKWTLPFNVKLIESIKVPIIIFGAGYNRNYTDKTLSNSELNSIKILNNKAKLISVRDNNTFELVKKSSGTESVLIGDPAIFLKSKKIDLPFKKSAIKIGLNIAYHESHTKSYADKIINLYVKLIHDLEKDHIIQLFYLKHSTDEEYIVKRIQEFLPQIIICDYESRELKYVYENLDLAISMMLHSTIFAYGSNVQFINIAYDEKNFAFMELINNTENIIDIRELDYSLLYKKCIAIIKNRNKHSKVISKDFFRIKIDKFMNDIKILE